MTFWHNRRVLITGAGGFIGSHLTERLIEAGARVRVLIRYNAHGDVGLLRELSPEKFGQIERFTGDLQDYRGVIDAATDIDTIFHLGALVAIPYSYKNPVSVIQTNVLGTTHILEAARLRGVRRVIHTSTSEVYGTARYVPIDEKHPLQGQSPYSASKIAADKIVESYVKSFNLPAVTVRPFNTYGPRQSARAVIPTIIMQALTRDAIKLGDLRPTRDFTFATDTARGFICAAESDAAIGQTVNLGCGFDISIGDLAEKIAGIVGGGKQVVLDESRMRPPDSEVMRLHADNRLAKQVMGWEPLVTLDEGLAHTVDWIRAHLDQYRPDEYAV